MRVDQRGQAREPRRARHPLGRRGPREIAGDQEGKSRRGRARHHHHRDAPHHPEQDGGEQGERHARQPDQGGRHVREHVRDRCEPSQSSRPLLRGAGVVLHVDQAPARDHGEQEESSDRQRPTTA